MIICWSRGERAEVHFPGQSEALWLSASTSPGDSGGFCGSAGAVLRFAECQQSDAAFISSLEREGHENGKATLTEPVAPCHVTFRFLASLCDYNF